MRLVEKLKLKIQKGIKIIKFRTCFNHKMFIEQTKIENFSNTRNTKHTTFKTSTTQHQMKNLSHP